MRHRKQAGRRLFGWRTKLVLLGAAVMSALIGWAVVARTFAGQSNTAATRFDVIIVLGYGADGDGNSTPTQLARVNEGVREYERNVAPRLLVTGGAVHNKYVEAEVMARNAAAQGIPASQIFIEPRARDTIENACYAVDIMKEHGWHSAEVVSSASHLPRAALIFTRRGIEWRTHAAPPLEPESSAYHAAVSVVETVKTMRYLVYSQWAERCE